MNFYYQNTSCQYCVLSLESNSAGQLGGAQFGDLPTDVDINKYSSEECCPSSLYSQ